MEHKKDFIILGGNMLLSGVYQRLHDMGYHVAVIDWNDNPFLKGDLHIQEDVKDEKAVIAAIHKYGLDVDGAFTSIDIAVPTINAIHKEFGLKTMPEKFDKVLTKDDMKRDWMRDGIFNRYSIVYTPEMLDEVLAKNKTLTLLVKPNVAASSRGITVVEKGADKNKILHAIDVAINASFDKTCLVEEYVTGREFTVDMMGDDYGNVSVYGISVKYHTKNTLGSRVAVKLHWNSNVYDDETYKRIAERGKQCYRSIGAKNSYGHLEMIMKEDGTMTPIEIAVRTSGFIASHLVPALEERDYLVDYINMLHGHPIPNEDHINGIMSSMWYKYNIPPRLTGVKKVVITDYFDDRINVLFSKNDGLVVGKEYGYIENDNSCDVEGFEMIAGPKDVLTIAHVYAAERAFLRDFAGYNGIIDED